MKITWHKTETNNSNRPDAKQKISFTKDLHKAIKRGYWVRAIEVVGTLLLSAWIIYLEFKFLENFDIGSILSLSDMINSLIRR